MQPFLSIRPDDKMPEYKGSVFDKLKINRLSVNNSIGLTLRERRRLEAIKEQEKQILSRSRVGSKLAEESLQFDPSEMVAKGEFKALLTRDVLVNPDPSFEAYYEERVAPKLAKIRPRYIQ